MTVRELEERLTFEEYLGWLAYLGTDAPKQSGNLLDLDPQDFATALTEGAD